MLEPGEVIAAIAVPASRRRDGSHYLKVRERASFEFAVVSVAVALEMDWCPHPPGARRPGRRGNQALARAVRSKSALSGSSLDPAPIARASRAGREGRRGAGAIDFKIELMQRAIVRAVETAGARA
jgi:xanthine dehydrogenase YagS FAD-binding subunit